MDPEAALRARIVPIERADDPRAADYRELREAALVEARGVFIAEGVEVVRTLVTRGRFPVRSLLLADKLVGRMADVILRTAPEVPTYVAPLEVLSAIAGFEVHRGCLAAGLRTPLPPLDVLLGGASPPPPGALDLLVVAEALANHDNVGGLFRNAAAFGARAVLLDPRSADPLYRKAIRVSMGATLTLPYARLEPWPDALEGLAARGYEVWALALGAGAADLVEAVAHRSPAPGRCALLVGTEGTGLTAEAVAHAARRFEIPMAPGVDSLNVATASGVALFALRALARGAGSPPPIGDAPPRR